MRYCHPHYRVVYTWLSKCSLPATSALQGKEVRQDMVRMWMEELH